MVIASAAVAAYAAHLASAEEVSRLHLIAWQEVSRQATTVKYKPQASYSGKGSTTGPWV
jgi:hypothetical protein